MDPSMDKNAPDETTTEHVKKVGYVYEERLMWHSPWIAAWSPLLQPFQHWEHPETKRRLHNLLVVSKVYDRLVHLRRIEPASKETIQLVHTPAYVEEIQRKSVRLEGGLADEETTFSRYAYDVAALAVGGAVRAVEEVVVRELDSAYVLCRPPGHHALPDKGAGFCVFNNAAVCARLLLRDFGDVVRRVAIVDYDVHHGNGTQAIFHDDPNVLFVSIHQDDAYPANSGSIEETGGESAKGTTVNVPLPPGSGTGAYRCAVDTVVVPSLRRFRPDFLLVSSGFDASYADPLSAMILSSEDFRDVASILVDEARDLCGGRVVFLHEGGYSESYVPFCGCAVIEAMLGTPPEERVEDPFLSDVHSWGGRGLQEHQ